jgi:ElaB/YqjD/DUF883 family membrane-anchored ribosome-binding protein
MFRQFPNLRVSAADIADIERRMHMLERSVQRFAGRTAASATQATDHVGDALAAALSDVMDRFRGSARSVGDEASRFGHEAARVGARLGGTALRKISDEVEHRPLMILAVAVGVGFLVGLAGRRH